MTAALSTRKINPLSPSGAMRRAAEQNEARLNHSQFATQIQQVRAAGREAHIAQAAQASTNTTSIFPLLANLLVPQSVSHYKVLNARAQAYESVAASHHADERLSIGSLLDMHA